MSIYISTYICKMIMFISSFKNFKKVLRSHVDDLLLQCLMFNLDTKSINDHGWNKLYSQRSTVVLWCYTGFFELMLKSTNKHACNDNYYLKHKIQVRLLAVSVVLKVFDHKPKCWVKFYFDLMMLLSGTP